MDTTAAIKKYMHFSASSGMLKDYLDALLPAFEKAFVQHQKTSQLLLLRVLIKFVLKRIELSEVQNASPYFFWPFQLHHCDFMMPVINQLKTEGITATVLVSRQDVYSKFKENGLQPERLIYTTSSRNLSSVLRKIREIIRLIQCSRGVKDTRWKDALFSALQYLGTVERARIAIKAIAAKHDKSYHMVGYDLSVVGRAISRYCRNIHIPCGRIQNGAVNYRLAGFSEVDDLFLWDKESEKAYKSNGYLGNTLITGNILLQDKYPAEKAFPEMNPILISGYSYRALVAFSGPGHNTSEKGHLESLKVLLQMVKENKHVLFVIKLHPKDKDHYYDTIKKEKNIRMAKALFPDKMPNAIKFIHATDIVITGASSVALDAINLNKPVISVDPLEELEHIGFIKHPKVKYLRKTKEVLNVTECIEELSITSEEAVPTKGVKAIVQELINCKSISD